MSVFTSLVTKVLNVPHDPGQTVTIRKLAPKHLDVAKRASFRQTIETMREVGASLIKEIQGLSSETVQAAAKNDPLMVFDRVELIAAAVTGWTYDVPLEREHFENLDEETQDWLAREVLRLTRPALFDGEAAEQKNG